MAFNGRRTNWLYGIKRPITADIKGILNVLLEIAILAGKIIPLAIWHWGTVGEINGYRTPLAKLGEYKFENPVKPTLLGIMYAWVASTALPFKYPNYVGV